MPKTITDRDDTPDGAVVVWIARVPEFQDSLPGLEELLDANERDRATRFRLPEDRARFITGRGLLRHGLRRYAPQVPASTEIIYTSLGRPQIPRQHDAPSFSISHTGELVALAFVTNALVGIDLEHMKTMVDIPELAERISSEEDLRVFQSFPHAERPLAFYRAWTRKEAYLKARGEGIASGLQQISVPFSAEKTSVLTDGRDASAPAWRLHALPLPEDYMGSLACDDATRGVKPFGVGLEKGNVQLKPL